MAFRSASHARLAGALWLTCIACIGLTCVRAARAEPDTALSWVREPGAESCIGATELGRRVERIVGPVLAPASAGKVSIEARIAKDGSTFVAHVVVSDAAGAILGRREVRSARDDCRALDETLAFVIAVAIDPNAAMAELPGEFSQDDEPGAALLAEMNAAAATPSPPPPSPNSAPPLDGTERARGAARSAGMTFGGGAGAGVAAAAGMLPALAVGPSVELAFFTGSWSHRLRGVLWMPQSASLQAAAQVEFDALQLGLTTCPRIWASSEFELALCAGAIAAKLSAEPSGFRGSAHQHWSFGPALEARLARRVAGPVWAVVSVSTQSLWPRPRVVYEESGSAVPVHRIAPVMGLAAISLELRF